MTNKRMPWIVYEIHNINYVIYLVLEKERRSLIESYALLYFLKKFDPIITMGLNNYWFTPE